MRWTVAQRPRKRLPLWTIQAGLLCLASASYGAPNFIQDHYRWRNDDGSESTATWKAPVDTPIAGQERYRNKCIFSLLHLTQPVVCEAWEMTTRGH